jgi:hypothetical protein
VIICCAVPTLIVYPAVCLVWQIRVHRKLRARRCVLFRGCYTKGNPLVILSEWGGTDLHSFIYPRLKPAAAAPLAAAAEVKSPLPAYKEQGDGSAGTQESSSSTSSASNSSPSTSPQPSVQHSHSSSSSSTPAPVPNPTAAANAAPNPTPAPTSVNTPGAATASEKPAVAIARPTRQASSAVTPTLTDLLRAKITYQVLPVPTAKHVDG